MSKTQASFIKSLAAVDAQGGETAPQAKATPSVSESNPEGGKKSAAAVETSSQASPIETVAGATDETAPTKPRRSQGGRPSSLKEGERAVRRNYQLTERDDVALKLYLESSAKERDLSEIIRNALRAYVPEDVYKAADVLISVKRSAIGKL